MALYYAQRAVWEVSNAVLSIVCTCFARLSSLVMIFATCFDYYCYFGVIYYADKYKIGERAPDLVFPMKEICRILIVARMFPICKAMIDTWSENRDFQLIIRTVWYCFGTHVFVELLLLERIMQVLYKECFIQQTKRMLISFLDRWHYYTRILREGNIVWWLSIRLQLYFIAFSNTVDISISEASKIQSPLQVSDRTFLKELGREQ